jgi:pimeloyl-ACP methyl ester carboxylesterase
MRSRWLRRSALVGIACLAAVLASPATGRAATAPSSGFNDWSCLPSAAHPQPVVLLHGLGGDGPGNFATLGPYLASAGYCVYAPTYGESVPGIPVGGITAIPQSATEIDAYLGQVLAATRATQVDLVGHSEGAFQALYGPKFVPGENSIIKRVVALAPPTHGTTFANLVTIGDDLAGSPLTDVIIAAGCPACSELVTGSSLVNSLDTNPIAQPGIVYTIIASTHDELVTPFGTEFVSASNVTNQTVQSFCPLDPVGHIGLAYDTDVAQLVRNALDPAQPVAVTCSVGPAF